MISGVSDDKSILDYGLGWPKRAVIPAEMYNRVSSKSEGKEIGAYQGDQSPRRVQSRMTALPVVRKQDLVIRPLSPLMKCAFPSLLAKEF